MAELLHKVIFLLLCVLKEYLSNCERNCYVAVAKCNEDVRCSHRLSRYANECDTIVDMYNTVKNATRFPCSMSCVRAIKSLRHTSKGRALWKCDCDVDAHCLMLKTRTEKCLAIENGTYRKRVGCTLAHYRCMRDKKCRNAQLDFLTKCSKLFTRNQCTNQCLCSQKRLFGLPMGKPLLDCECDGGDELYCLGLRALAESKKCSWKKRRTRKRLRKRCKRCRQRKGDRCGRRSQKRKD